MTSHSTDNLSSAALVHKLVCHILKKPPDAVKTEYRNALQSLNCSFAYYDNDEFTICENIKKKLILEDRLKDALTFAELHRKLQVSTVLKNRANVLQFLYSLCGMEKECPSFEKLRVNTKVKNSNSEISVNSHDFINQHISNPVSKEGSLDEFFTNRNASNCINFARGGSMSSNGKDNMEGMQARSTKVASLFSMTNSDKHFMSQPNIKQDKIPEKAMSIRSDESNIGSISSNIPNLKPLLHDLLYALQGLRGNIIHWEPEKGKYDVEFKADLPNPVKRVTLRFMEMGWMYCQIHKFCESQSKIRSYGLTMQSFVAALKSKLVDYYKLIAELEALLTQESTLEQNSSTPLTLHRLSVWLFEPHTELKILASVVDACKDKKGGSLASALYSHLQHGDYFVHNLIQNLLKDVTRPLFKMLSNWIYRGELEDAFGEFFVATNIAVPDNNLWHEKYSLNKAMIPSFITMEQARKILSTGKAINFLHQVCQDNTFSRDEDRHIKALELMSTESLFSQEKDSNFESILEKNYVKTSKTVLRVLHDKYNLMDHLLAMRNYFLLGQGDFIRHLMDLLDADLAKPAKSLYIHNLTGIVESAIRATNAQFHNPEVLQRLDVRMLEVSIGDTGWDVFSLDYHVDGPIGTVFTANSMNSYLRIFTTLWRAKRMEYILSKISHSRTTYLQYQAKLPEVTPVLYQCHIILAQMVHFVQQMQYYMAFEVMECCWADLLTKISSAQDLDQVIAAHENFLDTLLTRALLDEESILVRTQLKTIYDLIIQFDKIQETFWDEVKIAVGKLNEIDDLVQSNTKREGWGITEKQRMEMSEPVARLNAKTIVKTKALLKILSNTYEDMVQKFLIMLNDQDDPNLRFLSFRLDFNEHFKSRNSRLQTSLTYQHRRKSIK